MAYLVELTEPRSVNIREYSKPEPEAGEVLLRTLYSGISAGTELATYRGTNPYLEKQWDPELALFLPGQSTFSSTRLPAGRVSVDWIRMALLLMLMVTTSPRRPCSMYSA